MSIATEITRLQTAKANIKTSIEAKGVVVPDATKINEYSALIDTIPTGGGSDLFKYVKRLEYLFSSATNLPSEIKIAPIQLDNGDRLTENFIYRAYAAGHENEAWIDLTLEFNQTTDFSLRGMLFQAYGVKTVKISGNLNHVTSYANMLNYCGSLRSVDAVIDFTSCASDSACGLFTTGSNTYITSMRFVANTASYSVDISGLRVLDDASIVSAANCLVAGVTGKTIKYYSTQKTRCSTLMGNNNNGTFEIDENGSMSLETFITTVKGWSLA